MIFRSALALLLAAVTLTKLNYPQAPKGNQVDDYHGVKVADPYRILEDADSPVTRKWVEAEDALFNSWIAQQPGRAAIKSQLTALWNYEKYGPIEKAGGHYFYTHNSGLQNQSVFFVRDSLNGAARELLDPNTYRKDGTAAISSHSASWNGKLFAYAVAQAGSDWQEWHVRDVATGKDLPDVVRWNKSDAVSWAPDDSGFYYSRYPEPPPAKLLTAEALNHKIYFHKLGAAQADDKLIYARPEDPDWELDPVVMEGGRWLAINIFTGAWGKNLLSVIDLTNPKAGVKDLITNVESAYIPVAVVGTQLYLQTTNSAPRGRVIAMDLLHPDRAHWKEIVPQREETLNSVEMADGKLILDYMKDAHSAARIAAADGKPLGEVAFPGLGTVTWSPARLGDKEVFFRFESYIVPFGVYRLDMESLKSTPVWLAKSAQAEGFDSAAYETKQIFYTSKDGTRVPMFLSYRKGMKPDGQNPTLLHGYGGFYVAETPEFDPWIAGWMQMGGIYALANLRGGAEYGDAWHEAGMRAKKQNVFDDFIAAAEWLIANKYTSTPRLSIYGRSNGGLLIGAVLNQRPDLFGAAMPSVGVMDMFRFQKFGYGPSWVGEYGSSDNAGDFQVLRKYSPLHNIRAGVKYPPVLITTADHDDRVMPGHSLKYAATLQQAQGGTAPILIRIETRAGHGAGTPTSKLIDEWTDRLTFLHSVLKM